MDKEVSAKESAAKVRCYHALSSLLEIKKFDKVSVSEILKLANISRSQFYRLFMDKYDLLDHTIIYQVDIIYTDDCDLGLFKSRMIGLLEMIKRNEIVLSLHNHYDEAKLFELYYHVFLRLHRRRMHRVQGGVVSPQLERAMRFCSAGSAQMIMEWLKSGCILSTLEMERELGACLPEVIRRAGHVEKQ